MWLREANIRSMKEAGTVIVFLVSSSISSFRVITFEDEEKKKKDVRKSDETEADRWEEDGEERARQAAILRVIPDLFYRRQNCGFNRFNCEWKFRIFQEIFT